MLSSREDLHLFSSEGTVVKDLNPITSPSRVLVLIMPHSLRLKSYTCRTNSSKGRGRNGGQQNTRSLITHFWFIGEWRQSMPCFRESSKILYFLPRPMDIAYEQQVRDIILVNLGRRLETGQCCLTFQIDLLLVSKVILLCCFLVVLLWGFIYSK